jgi:hypothetical protein
MRNLIERWLPIGFEFNGKSIIVRWMDFAGATLAEPFYIQTVRRLRLAIPPAAERVTQVFDLISQSESVPLIDPAVLIFHVSRCGSTLLANALRLDKECVVLSEAAPIGAILGAQFALTEAFTGADSALMQRTLLQSVVRLYANAFGPKVVLKCHAASILQIARLRMIWPSLPFVVLIREPLEVLVSNLAKPAGWVRSMHRPIGGQKLFGMTAKQIQQMSTEEYCAKGLGQFLLSASSQLDDKCFLLDYEDLNPPKVFKLATLLNFQLPDITSPEMNAVFKLYSKDPLGLRTFEDDSKRKRNESSTSVQRLVAQYAAEPYDRLKTNAFYASRGTC